MKASAFIIHGAGWLIFISLPLLFASGFQGSGNVLSTLVQPDHLFFYTSYIFLFYFNTVVLIPRLYLRKKYTMYFSIILLLLIAVIYLRPFDHLMTNSFQSHMVRSMPGSPGFPPAQDSVPAPSPGNPPPEFGHGPPPFPGRMPPGRRPAARFDAVSLFLFIMILALSITAKISAQLQKTEQRVARAEADKANAELSFLKAQINPHFLFNTLNNIYSLAVTRSEYTADSIMKLSNIMRYVTDDSKEDYVNLQNEIDFIVDYIDLQRLRLGTNDRIDFSVSGDWKLQKIAPLILMPFVENVFKYGVSKHDESPIVIKLFAGPDFIEFFCRNKIYPVNRTMERTGIGISNTRQRLQYLYPGRYDLTIDTANDYYTVKLLLRN